MGKHGSTEELDKHEEHDPWWMDDPWVVTFGYIIALGFAAFGLYGLYLRLFM